MPPLHGKTAVVTGTSRGLGRDVAAGFRAAGASVIGASRSEGYDLTREDDVRRLFRETVARHGRVDILVNCAGVLTPRKPLAEVSREEWERSLAGNLTSVFLTLREAIPIMTRQREGLIVNVGSGVSTRAAPTWGPYAAAKWGVEGLTKLLAEEVREAGIRVVSVNPLRTRTPMRAAAYPDEDPETVKTPEETARYFVALAEGRVEFESGDHLEYRPGF